MKSLIKPTAIFALISLIIVNVFIFIKSINLAESINYYESGIKKLHAQNIDLEMEVNKLSSLQYTASQAAMLDFTHKVEPIYPDKLQYAKLPE